MNTARLLLLENKSWVQEKLALDPEYFQRFTQSQQPEFLWIGCSDSRVPTNEITVTTAGELFVHRNVANLVSATDVNALSAVQYAVETLKVRHVVVCGHYGCGGVRAAIDSAGGDALGGPLGQWLEPIRALLSRHQAEIEALSDDRARWDRMVELNTIAQVEQLRRSPVIQAAWARERTPSLHGWVYRMDTGTLEELVAFAPPELSEAAGG